MKRRTLAGAFISVSILLMSCSSPNEELKPPGTVPLLTSGEICKEVRKGLEASPLASAVAVGTCTEQKTPSGGRSLWIEISDLSVSSTDDSPQTLKYLMVSVAVSLTAFGFRATGENPSDFEQLFYSILDKSGSNFEIPPAEMQQFIPGDDITQDEWDALVDSRIIALLPKIEIRT